MKYRVILVFEDMKYDATLETNMGPLQVMSLIGDTVQGYPAEWVRIPNPDYRNV